MAALNTLRTKGAIFMTIMIAFALLAFLVSDQNFMNQSPDVVVGTVNGEEISMRDYMTEIEDETFFNQFISGQQSLSPEQTEMLHETMWQKLVLDDILGTSIINLGLGVGDDERIDMAQGKFTSPVLLNLFTNQQGELDRQALVAFVSNIDMDPTGSSRKFWNQLEQQIDIEREMSKYLALVTAGQYATDLDANFSFSASKDVYDVKFISVPFSQDSVAVSDSELRAYYDKNKQRYRTEPYREISYVSFQSVPSQDDYTEAKKEFDTLLEEFTSTSNPIQFVELNSEEQFDARFYSEKNINPEYKDFAFGKNSDGVYVAPFIGDIHSAVRVADAVSMPDSITYRILPVMATNNVDSIINVIKTQRGGFDKMAQEFAIDPTVAQMPATTTNTSDIIEQQLIKVKRGDVVNMGVQQGGYVTLVYIERTTPNVMKKQLARFVQTVVPSAKTDQYYYSLANEFADKAHQSGANFDEVALSEGAIKRVASLRAQDRTVSSIPDTKELVRFAYNSTVGQVSNVISIGSSNYVAVLTEIVDGEYIPFEDVKEGITAAVRAQKNTDMLKAELAKFASLDEAADNFNVEVQQAEQLTYASMYIPGLGISPEFVGEMIVTPVDKLSKPVASTTSVALFVVVGKTPQDNITLQGEKIMIESLNATNLENRVVNALMQNAKIEDYRILYM